MFAIARLNHAALYVRDAQRLSRFYQETLGFIARQRSDQQVFLSTSATTKNNHDLVLIGIEADAPEPTDGRRPGLYHLAWEVESLPDLASARVVLLAAGVLTSDRDHGSSLSLYAKDPKATSSRCSGLCRAKSGQPARAARSTLKVRWQCAVSRRPQPR